MKQTAFRLICFVLLVTLLPAVNLSQTRTDLDVAPDTVRLEPGNRLDRELKAGEEHIYTVKLEGGRFAIVIYRYNMIDITARLFAPDASQPLRTANYPTDGKTPLNMTVLVREPGVYRLVVSSNEIAKNAGRYRISIAPIADAVRIVSDPLLASSAIPQIRPRDIRVRNLARALIDAKTDEERTALLSKDQTLVTATLLYELIEHRRTFTQQMNYEKGLAAAHLILGLAEKIGDKREISAALYNLGIILMMKGDYPPALEAAQKSLEMNESLTTNDSSRTRITNADGRFLIASIYERQSKNAQALDYYQQSLAVYNSVRITKSVVNTLMRIGVIYLRQGKQEQAIEAFENALKLFETSDSKIPLIQTMISIGSLCSGEGSQELGEKHLQKSLGLSEELGDRNLIIRASAALASFYSMQGNDTPALQYYEKLLKLYEESGDRSGLAATLGFISFVYRDRQDFFRSMEYCEKSLKLYEELENPAGITMTLAAMSNIYFYQGNYVKAIECHESALTLNEKLKNKSGMAAVLSSIAFVYSAQGNKVKALEYYQKSLKLREELNDTNYITGLLFSIESLNGKSNFEQKMEFFQKNLTLYEAAGNKRGMLTPLSSMGWLAKQHGKYELALEYFQRYLKTSEMIGDNRAKVEALWHFADIYLLQKRYDKALEFAESTTLLGKQIGRQNYVWLGKLIAGKAYLGLNQLDKAQQALEDSITTIESVRSNITGEEERAKYFSQVQQPYEIYIDLLMRKHKEQPSTGNDALALEISERVRARSLLELLSEANTDIRQGVDPQLLERERFLQQQLNARAEQQTRLLGEQYDAGLATRLQKEIDALTFDYRNNQAMIKLKSPRYAALTQPQPVKLNEIQKEILDRDSVLLEYKLGEKQSYLWLVTKDSSKVFELPPRVEIEATVRRAYAVLSDGSRVIDETAQAEYEKLAARLSQMLLAPVASLIKNKRLVIVADGALQYLPFGALPSPNLTPALRQPLIVENEIVSLPSVSTLAVLRRETGSRRQAAKSVAVFADPVFSETDERLTLAKINKPSSKEQTPAKSGGSRTMLERFFYLGGESNKPLQIARLPFSRREADAILGFSPAASSLKALDFKASRETALSDEISQYRIVHFAAHGLLNSEHPELSGIVLSLVNEQGEPINGFLRLNEIYNLNLSADIVVLSACQTALGKEIKGEGLIGLTRGFMYAGSRRVVASLWKVDDAATAELMKIFYEKMLKEKMRPAAALRAAKVEMWKQKRWNAPFYWAAFELQGEWR
jgi:CHAT domain-containing protein/Tfp pilus assembly protein PilF